MIKAAPHLDHEEMLTMNLKLNNKRTILVGLAFLSICAFWQMYNSVIPKILTYTFHLDETYSGIIMAAVMFWLCSCCRSSAPSAIKAAAAWAAGCPLFCAVPAAPSCL